jgi:DNA adenine methylase
MPQRSSHHAEDSCSDIGPILKWAGGKSQLLKNLVPLVPVRFSSYFEPFFGGGALFFHLLANRPSLRAYISDANPELVNCYLRVRDDVDEVIAQLKRHRNDKHHYYKVRSQDPSELDEVGRAARLIFLNKTCFNGLFRVNRRGQFNVPFGKYKNPRIVDEGRLRRVSRSLQQARVAISCCDFDRALARARAGDFVYLDPPYQPLTSTSRFTSYTRRDFVEQDQFRLAKTFRALDARGVFVLLSNSDSHLVRTLYEDFQIDQVLATRAINCNGKKRGRIGELLIRNY